MAVSAARRVAMSLRSPSAATMAVEATRSMRAVASPVVTVHRTAGTRWREAPPAVMSMVMWVLVMVFMVGFLSVGIGLNSIELLTQ